MKERKKLADMTLEELWALFPIVLSEHKTCWDSWYAEEAQRIKGLLGEAARISHIGSTAIAGIWAKPIVDILAELPGKEAVQAAGETLKRNGYLHMSETENRISLNRGYTEEGFAERVFHVHLRCYGDNDELYFRDYMREHPALAAKYEKLKLSLWKTYEHNRDGYTEAKGDFVLRCTECAKQEYGDRYGNYSAMHKYGKSGHVSLLAKG